MNSLKRKLVVKQQQVMKAGITNLKSASEVAPLAVKDEPELYDTESSVTDDEIEEIDDEDDKGINPFNFVTVKLESQNEGSEGENEMEKRLLQNEVGEFQAEDREGRENGNTVLHKNFPERKFSCTMCSKRFLKKSNVTRHMSVHTGIRPFACDVCGKAFSQKGDLNTHMRIHTGDRPYGCDVCHKAFVSKKELRTHSRVHTGIRPYSCELCSMTFSRKAHLNKHVRVHTRERPFACEICSKAFSAKSNLNRHYLLHTGNRSHTCDICNKSFLTNGDLDRHSRTHTGFHPYSCKVCGKSFSRKDNFNKHMRCHLRKGEINLKGTKVSERVSVKKIYLRNERFNVVAASSVNGVEVERQECNATDFQRDSYSLSQKRASLSSSCVASGSNNARREAGGLVQTYCLLPDSKKLVQMKTYPEKTENMNRLKERID